MEDFKFYSRVAFAALVRWLALAGLGLMLTLAGIAVGLALTSNNAGSGYHGANSGSAFGAVVSVVILLRDEFWTATLLAASIGFIAIYFLIASKFSISFILHRLLENRLLPTIGTRVAVMLRTFVDRSNNGLRPFANAGELKKRLSNLISEDKSSNRIQRRVIKYGLKKLDLHNVDFSRENLNVPDVISNKLTLRLSEAAKPSYQLFLLVSAAHVALLILALVFDHH